MMRGAAPPRKGGERAHRVVGLATCARAFTCPYLRAARYDGSVGAADGGFGGSSSTPVKRARLPEGTGGDRRGPGDAEGEPSCLRQSNLLVDGYQYR